MLMDLNMLLGDTSGNSAVVDGGEDAMTARFLHDKRQALQRDQLISALVVCRSVDYDDIVEEITQSFGVKSPISILMEHVQYARSKVNFVEVGQPDGPDHRPMFTMVAVVDGHPYTRVRASCKRDCRTGAAYFAWKNIIQEEQAKLRSLVNDERLSEEDHMAAISHLEYLIQVEQNPFAFSGRRILAAVIEKRCYNNGRKSAVHVVSLGTGNRCILSAHLSLDGTSVNDSHAEVIARRAFVKYLYTQIAEFKSGNDDTIFHCSHPNSKLSLKPGISFHLYSSSAPCGDASLFSRETTGSQVALPNKCDNVDDMHCDSQQPIYSSSVQGVLRTKIEAGEGSIPIERKCLQSWIGLQFGGRLRTMSCSDKILKWNVLGLQGALLARFMEPVYLSSINVGDPFVYGHLTRALYHRILRDIKHASGTLLDLPPGYRINCPLIRHTKVGKCCPETEKSTAITVVWHRGARCSEVIDGTIGNFCEDLICRPEFEKRLPMVCKKSFFEDFRALDGQVDGDLTYYDAKQLESDYQMAKSALYRDLVARGFGDWIKKPMEIDFFV